MVTRFPTCLCDLVGITLAREEILITARHIAAFWVSTPRAKVRIVLIWLYVMRQRGGGGSNIRGGIRKRLRGILTAFRRYRVFDGCPALAPRSPDVSSGDITGSSLACGRAAAVPLLRCVWDLAALCAAMLVDHGSQILACANCCSTVVGSIFCLVLGYGCEDIARLLFGRPGGFCPWSARCGGFSSSSGVLRGDLDHLIPQYRKEGHRNSTLFFGRRPLPFGGSPLEAFADQRGIDPPPCPRRQERRPTWATRTPGHRNSTCNMV